jgi:predicted dehydrogenase
MADKVRLGIIGTSGWTDLIYLSKLHNDPVVEIAALSGRNQERASALATQYAITSTFADYRDLLAHPGLDGVIVATPDDLHLSMTLAAIDAGLNVLCEKPLANSAADAQAMLEAAEQARIKHMVMFTWRWQPHYQFLKSLVEAGSFGRIYRCQFSFLTNFANDRAYQWRMDPGRANGIVGDLGSHMIDLGNWMLGTVSSVSADLGTAVSRAGLAGHEGGSGYDIAHLTLRFANGIQGVVDVTNVSHDADRVVKHVVRIEAEKAAIELEHVFFGPLAGLSLQWFGAGEKEGRALEVPQQFYGKSNRSDLLDIYAKEATGARAFGQAIRDGVQPSPDFADGVRAQLVVDAALRSHAERRWIDL